MSNTKENETVYAFGSPAATAATDKVVKADKAGEGEKTAKTAKKVKLPFKKLMNFRLSVFAAGATIAGIFCAENYLLGKTVSAAVFLCFIYQVGSFFRYMIVLAVHFMLGYILNLYGPECAESHMKRYITDFNAFSFNST